MPSIWRGGAVSAQLPSWLRFAQRPGTIDGVMVHLQRHFPVLQPACRVAHRIDRAPPIWRTPPGRRILGAMSDVTRILSQIDAGDPAAAERLLPLVYDELRKLAAAKLAHEKPGQTLQATALVHEAYLRLVGPEVGSQQSEVGGQRWEGDATSDLRSPTSDLRPPTSPAFHSRGHFFAAAA